MRRTVADAIAFARAMRRDQMIVLLGLTAMIVLAWGYLIVGDAGALPSTPGRTWMMGPVWASWTPPEAVSVLVMWVVMMVAMMLPTAAPTVLAYAKVGRRESSHARPLAATAWFTAGYLLVWTGVAFAAAAGQWWLGQAGWLDPMTGRGSDLFDGCVLSGAGLYQLTPMKDRCLRLCQSPVGFVQRHGGSWRDGGGDLSLGVRQGVYCVGCCWCLMTLPFVGGVLNLAWIAAISAFILVEKITPSERLVSRLAALGLAATGVTLLFLGLRATGLPH